ncbi:MAG: V-type ATPase subunit [Nitrospinae bacterium]|nr:V-type ATPase subunit [Nitrospinota bacterium]
MEIEYTVTRLKALAGRFPSYGEFIRILQMEDARGVAGLLEGSVFAPEMESLVAKGETDISPMRLLRVMADGHHRLRRHFAGMAMQTDPRSCRAILMRWEIEELKSALRYLKYHGEKVERRFGFNSLILPEGKTPLWEAKDRSLAHFIAALAQARHPLAPAVDREEYLKDTVKAELGIERYFYGEWLPSQKGIAAQAAESLADRLDAANIAAAMLIREAKSGRGEASSYYVAGCGEVMVDDFMTIVEGPAWAPFQIVKKKMGLSPRKGSEISATIFALEIKRALARRYKLACMLDPVGMRDFVWFMEELDITVSNLKLAVNHALTHTPAGEAADIFIKVTI